MPHKYFQLKETQIISRINSVRIVRCKEHLHNVKRCQQFALKLTARARGRYNCRFPKTFENYCEKYRVCELTLLQANCVH